MEELWESYGGVIGELWGSYGELWGSYGELWGSYGELWGVMGELSGSYQGVIRVGGQGGDLRWDRGRELG